MAKYTASVVADGDVYVCHINRRGEASHYLATILAYGTWGGGTITWKLSPDNGVTKIPLKTITGTSITSNADDNLNTNFGNPAKNTDTLSLYATMAGSTSPSVTIAVYDNN